ncbi:MAG: GGDEF domain-containing protein [Lachnospiraceae bacterium]|nr:GGDEF domain-containing protein [Lachnospiraceae bacterium]
MLSSNKRLTIGVLVSGILDEFTSHICNGIMLEARKQNADVIIFPGKYLDRDLQDNRELMYEYQYSTVFAFPKKENLDALIVAADCIGCFVTKDRIRSLLEQYRDIPTILIASKMDGYVDVTFDNVHGIQEALEYLIHACGCRKFGMIGGNKSNTDARERKEVFLSVLKEHGIAWDDSMFAEGNLSRRSTRAYRTLLDRHPDLDAVFCVNDDTAIGLYSELKKRGLQPGKNISVLGFDDTQAAAKTIPPLSSVRADPNQLGEAAVSTLISLLNQEQKADVVIPTRFVLRDSICPPLSAQENRLHVLEHLDTSFHDIFYRNYHAEMEDQIDGLKQAYVSCLTALASHFHPQDAKPAAMVAVFHSLDQLLNHPGLAQADMDALMTVFEGLYHELQNRITDKDAALELRDTYLVLYKKIIRAMNRQTADVLANEYKTNYDVKLFVQNILQFEQGNDQSYCSLLQNLDWLQIQNARLYLYQAPVEHAFLEPFEAPDTLYLKAVLKNGIVSQISADQQARSLSSIFTQDQEEDGPATAMVLLPLFSGRILYGVLLCDMTQALFTNGEFLVNQLGSAIKMITLLDANEKIQMKLEDNLAMLKDHNIELDTLSKSDQLTGILNRRGFYSRAEELIQQYREENRPALLFFVDMNNLKIINDRYGHKEGDSSLSKIGQFLKELTGNRGIAGRIGGDEFVCLLATRGFDDEEEILSFLYRKFDDYNKNSSKPYNLTISAGACPLLPDSTITLKEALTAADQKLYEAKKHKCKIVEKETAANIIQ